MNMPAVRTRNAHIALFAACAVCTAHAAERSASYPNHPVRLVVPAPPGGSVDVMARLLARQLEPQLGQAIVVDNRGGANGIIGIDIVSKAPADGYTLLSTASVFAINPAIYRKLPYDTEKDFVPVANFANGPGYLFVVHPSVPATTLKELVALAREKPLRYGTAGIGNGQHLVGELLNMTAGIQLQHVPYKGGGPAFNAVVSGEVHVHFAAAITALAHVKAARRRARPPQSSNDCTPRSAARSTRRSCARVSSLRGPSPSATHARNLQRYCATTSGVMPKSSVRQK